MPGNRGSTPMKGHFHWLPISLRRWLQGVTQRSDIRRVDR
jgi:hypothetical protein